MTAQYNILAQAQRRHLLIFVMKVFEHLHPGRPLAPEWYLEAICYQLEKLEASGYGRLVINLAPRHLKSIVTSVAFAAWILGRNPGRRVMVACYSSELSREHAEHCRVIMESDWYKRLFPATRISARGNRQLELITTSGGGRKAVSVGGSITGFGADIIIIDDCMKADDVRSQVEREAIKSWFDNTLLTRLNDRDDSAILSIQQRLHEDDLTAYLLAKGYEHLNLPSIAQKTETIRLSDSREHKRFPGELLTARQSQRVLDALRREMGPVGFSAQYQQEPVAPGGNLVKWEWFGTYDEEFERDDFLKVVQSWDTAMSEAPTADYSVGTTWGFRENYKWYLLDVFRQRLDYPNLKKAVLHLKRKWRADEVIVEDAGSGKSLWQDIKHTTPHMLTSWRVAADKETRFNATLSEVEAGHILLPVEAPWLDAFRSELKAFPLGRHDDQVDSFSQFIEFQQVHWKWLLTEYDERGRPMRPIRLDERPW